MKPISIFFIFTALAMSVSSCSKDLADPLEPDPSQAVELLLTGEIDYMLPETRVGSSGFEQGDAIGVYAATTTMTNYGNKADNKKFTYNGSSSQFEAVSGNEITWESDSEKLDIYAYYPYNQSVTSAGAIPVEVKADQSTEANFYTSDVLRANVNNVAKTTEAVGLTFKHMMSKLSITLLPGTGFDADEFAEAEKEITIEGLVTNGELNLKNNELIKEGSATQTITTLAGNNNTFSAIVVPQNSSSEVKIRLKMGDKYYATKLSSVSYEQGKEYKYNLKVKKSASGMVVKSTSISKWGEGATKDGDMKEETSN